MLDDLTCFRLESTNRPGTMVRAEDLCNPQSIQADILLILYRARYFASILHLSAKMYSTGIMQTATRRGTSSAFGQTRTGKSALDVSRRRYPCTQGKILHGGSFAPLLLRPALFTIICGSRIVTRYTDCGRPQLHRRAHFKPQ